MKDNDFGVFFNGETMEVEEGPDDNFAILLTDKREGKRLVFTEWQGIKSCAEFAEAMFPDEEFPKERYEIIILPLVKAFVLSESGDYYTVGEGIFEDIHSRDKAIDA